MNKTNHTYPAVEVLWHDAFSMDAWDFLDEHLLIATQPYPCRTVGWLVRRDKQCVVLVQSLARDGTRAAATMTIPRGMVQSIRYLYGKKGT
jgi:hypothetical protein